MALLCLAKPTKDVADNSLLSQKIHIIQTCLCSIKVYL